MEEQKADDHFHAKPSCPIPTGIPINWGLITGPVPEPVFSTSSLNASVAPSQNLAAHSLQTKVKSLPQRRTRGRERERDRERWDTDVPTSNPAGQISSEVYFRQRPRGKGQLSLNTSSWRSGTAKDMSTSDEEEEVEVQVRLQIHSPPIELQTVQVGEESEEEKSENTSETGQPCGLREGTCLKGLLLENSCSKKDRPSSPPPPPALSSSVPTSSTAASSSSAKLWAPPKGFWRVARPETLLLNGVGPHNIPSTLPLKDYTQIEEQLEPHRKLKSSETGNMYEAGSVADDTDALPKCKQPDGAECYLDRCEEKEADVTDSAKGMCSSDSWESMSSQSGVLCADLKLRVKERAYAKLRERQQNCREERDHHGGENVGYYGDITYTVDCKGESLK